MVGSLSSFFFQAEDGIRDWSVTGVQTCALPIFIWRIAGSPAASTSITTVPDTAPVRTASNPRRSEERRVGKECRAGWRPQEQETRERDRATNTAERQARVTAREAGE